MIIERIGRIDSIDSIDVYVERETRKENLDPRSG